MQLPPALRAAIDRELEGVPLRDLTMAAERLSQRYRAEIRDGRLHIDDGLAARAYLTTRLPATFAAIAASLAALAEILPGFHPRSVLDIGAGPGTATWAAASTWESVAEAVLVEASPAIREIGTRLAGALPLRCAWQAESLADGLRQCPGSDLVVMAYVLDELEPARRAAVIARLWELAAGAVLIVEPGTTEGWKRILAARDQLLAGGAQILAPCPHDRPCPLSPPDWCHFAARVARSRLHRVAKAGTVPWEDEKFIYLAASRGAPAAPLARILAPPQHGKAGVRVKLCHPSGALAERNVAKRDGVIFKAVRKLGWGDRFPDEDRPETH